MENNSSSCFYNYTAVQVSSHPSSLPEMGNDIFWQPSVEVQKLGAKRYGVETRTTNVVRNAGCAGSRYTLKNFF